jgi:hypothetical protein
MTCVAQFLAAETVYIAQIGHEVDKNWAKMIFLGILSPSSWQEPPMAFTT